MDTSYQVSWPCKSILTIHRDVSCKQRKGKLLLTTPNHTQCTNVYELLPRVVEKHFFSQLQDFSLPVRPSLQKTRVFRVLQSHQLQKFPHRPHVLKYRHADWPRAWECLCWTSCHHFEKKKRKIANHETLCLQSYMMTGSSNIQHRTQNKQLLQISIFLLLAAPAISSNFVFNRQ